MNHLAHLFLAAPTAESLIGNLSGDFVKGAIGDRFPPGIAAGIAQHRRIDAFTDAHPSGGFEPGYGTHGVEHRAIDAAGNIGDAESFFTARRVARDGAMGVDSLHYGDRGVAAIDGRVAVVARSVVDWRTGAIADLDGDLLPELYFGRDFGPGYAVLSLARRAAGWRGRARRGWKDSAPRCLASETARPDGCWGETHCPRVAHTAADRCGQGALAYHPAHCGTGGRADGSLAFASGLAAGDRIIVSDMSEWDDAPRVRVR